MTEFMRVIFFPTAARKTVKATVCCLSSSVGLMCLRLFIVLGSVCSGAVVEDSVSGWFDDASCDCSVLLVEVVSVVSSRSSVVASTAVPLMFRFEVDICGGVSMVAGLFPSFLSRVADARLLLVFLCSPISIRSGCWSVAGCSTAG